MPVNDKKIKIIIHCSHHNSEGAYKVGENRLCVLIKFLLDRAGGVNHDIEVGGGGSHCHVRLVQNVLDELLLPCRCSVR